MLHMIKHFIGQQSFNYVNNQHWHSLDARYSTQTVCTQQIIKVKQPNRRSVAGVQNVGIRQATVSVIQHL